MTFVPLGTLYYIPKGILKYRVRCVFYKYIIPMGWKLITNYELREIIILRNLISNYKP